LDDLFAKINADGVQIDGRGASIQHLTKTALERDLHAELLIARAAPMSGRSPAHQCGVLSGRA